MKLITITISSKNQTDIKDGFILGSQFANYLKFYIDNKFDFSLSYSPDKLTMYIIQVVHPDFISEAKSKWRMVEEEEKFESRNLTITLNSQNAFLSR